MITEQVDAHNGFIEVWVRALRDIIVKMLFVAERVETFEDEVEESFQVLGTWAGDEDIRIAMGECSSDSKPKSCRLATTTRCSQRDSR